MAKYDIKHTCGCTKTYQLTGKSSDISRKKDWLEGKDCSICENKQFPPRFVFDRFSGVNVFNSFEIKDQLKERGYIYQAHDFSWRKHFGWDKKEFYIGEHMPELQAEFEFLKSLGAVHDHDKGSWEQVISWQERYDSEKAEAQK